MPGKQTRRAFVGAAAASCLGLLAGCGGSDGADSPDATETEPSVTDTPLPSIDQYLEETSNYDGTVQDETGRDIVTVDVGTEGNDGDFAFSPAAIRVDTGTTVTWVWTGDGGNHNVVAENAPFRSKQLATEGHEFEYTFEASGEFLYYCQPHEDIGMKGAVVVE